MTTPIPTLTDADRFYSHTGLSIIKEKLTLCGKEGQEVLATLFNESQLTIRYALLGKGVNNQMFYGPNMLSSYYSK